MKVRVLGWAIVFAATWMSFGCGGGDEVLAQTDATGTAAATSNGDVTPKMYSVGGNLSGLASGKTVVLRNNGTDDLTLSANGAFAFATKVVGAAAYAVTVQTQPVGQTCTVSNGVGTVSSSNVSSVTVSCVVSPTTTTTTATLLFKSNFGPGVSLSKPRSFSSNGAWQDLVGTDKETGYSWPVAKLGATFSGVQLITADPITESTIGDYITNGIASVIGPDGKMVNELFQNVKIKPIGAGGTQAPFTISRPWTIGDVTDLYTTFWFRFQDDLDSKLSSTISGGNWITLFEFKTGGYENTWRGDYRITVYVFKGSDGKLYWHTAGDNVANGPWDKVIYWKVDNHTVPVPLGKWFKFEAYWHRSTGSDGRYWAAVNGQVIVDRFGPNMGDYKLPINRIFVTNPYSGGAPTLGTHVTGLEFWDGFPCGVGKSCYGAP